MSQLESEIERLDGARQQLQVQNVDLMAEIDSIKAEKEELQSELDSLSKKETVTQVKSSASGGGGGWDTFEPVAIEDDENKNGEQERLAALVQDLEEKLRKAENESIAQEDKIRDLFRELDEVWLEIYFIC